MPLPNRAYYSFPDVLEHLRRENISCSMSDLLHFSLIGSIEPLIYVVGEWEYKGNKSDGRDLCHSIDANNSDITLLADIKPEKVKTELCVIDISIEEIKHRNTKRKPRLFISIEGFMSLYTFGAHAFYSDLNTYNEADMSGVVLFPYTENCNDATDNEDEIKINSMIVFSDKIISTRDLYITHNEFESLKKGGREDCSRNIKLDIDKPPSSPHPKTSNSQAKVIKALIEAIGGKHAANHPRNAIDNRNSELNKKLDLAGVKLPASGVTVEKWLKGID